MEIDPAHPVPIYHQLKTLLMEAILERRYGPEERLPTEHELCKQYRISRTPVSRALSELADEGVILRHRRRGSFVNPHWLSRRPDDPEIRVTVPAYGPWEQLIREASDGAFAVNIVRVQRHALHRVLTHAVAEGQAPDLAVFDHVWAPEFAAAGFLHALEDLDRTWVHREHDADFLAPLAAADRYRGQTFGVSAFAEVAGLWYRRRELEAHGLAPPATWTQLRAVARTLTRARGAPALVMPGGTKGGETTAYCLIGFLASNGAQVLTPTGVSLGSPAAVEVLRFLRRLVSEGFMPLEIVGYEWDRPIQLLADGRAAISVGGSYEAQTLTERLGLSQDELKTEFGFIPIPAGPRGAPSSVAGAMIFAIFRQAAHPKAAMRLLERAVAPQALAGIARRTGRVPSRRSAVALASRELPFLERTGEILERAVTRPWTPLYSRVSVQLQTTLEGVLTGRLRPTAAAHRTAEMIGAITGLPVPAGRAAATAETER